MGAQTGSTEFVCNLTSHQDQTLRICYIVNVALNAFFCITAILENAVILAALWKSSGLLARSKVLFINLAITDLAVGLTSQPLWVAVLTSALQSRPSLCKTLKEAGDISATILFAVSLVTIALISGDRLLALRLQHHERGRISTEKKLLALLAAFWMGSVLFTLIKLWNFKVSYTIQSVAIFICVVLSSFCYIKIFIVLGKQKANLQRADNEGLRKGAYSAARLIHYKKSVSSAMCVFIALLVCYMPFVLIHVAWVILGGSHKLLVAKLFSFTLLYINSSLNPSLYCWKSRIIRRDVKKTLFSLLCSRYK